MRSFFLLLIFGLCLIRVNSQTNFSLKDINKNPVEAAKDEKEIDRLSKILIQDFLQKANDPATETNRQIQLFFSEQLKPGDNARFQCPQPIKDSDLSASVTQYNYSWDFTPAAKDSLNKLEGRRDKTLSMMVSIPLYTAFHKGYAINSISFICSLSEVIHWAEDENSLTPIEQLSTYSKNYNLSIKKIITDN